jgi:hypothetical protein
MPIQNFTGCSFLLLASLAFFSHKPVKSHTKVIQAFGGKFNSPIPRKATLLAARPSALPFPVCRVDSQTFGECA